MVSVDRESLYLLWLKRIVQSHASKVWDEPQTAEDDEEDEWFNAHWQELDETHRHRLWGLSADLNTLRDKETWVEEDWSPMTQAGLLSEQAEAFRCKDWDRLLESLRRPPRCRAREDIDYVRGRAWMEMGHSDVALLFFDNASRLDPANLAYPTLALECLKVMPDWNEALKRAERYRQTSGTHPRLLFRAADVFHVTALRLGETANYEKAVEVVDRGLAMLKDGAAHETIESVIAGGYATKAAALEHLDRHEDALDVFNEAVTRFPFNATLLTARGLLKQELGKAGALDDFQKAVEQNTVLVWPYLEMARDALHKNQYETTVKWARRGLECRTRGTVNAILYQFIAIASVPLGESHERIRSAFDAAMELDSLNPEIQANRLLFETSVRTGTVITDKWQVTAGNPLNALDEIRSALYPIAA